ncbi:hypothetical protein CDD81_7 [Ophiocordyceps australis]|uniref:Uncharacterized protein n=1 Tax=Ophiocordyceps australis TaxID=1399860 RepID=A0A2C5XCK5_9HYPO|nr:hypothetical protein CDD81_7 [Ophiocordyceps australis]
MAPPCPSFSAAQLPQKVQFTDSRRRKFAPDAACHRIELAACPLLSLVQYKCTIDAPEVPDSPVRCRPVTRLFRR